MILIADSGSTKAAWRLVSKNGVQAEITTQGMNPFFRTTDDIATEIANIVGCVVQPDMFGIAIEDIDGDQQVEIVAGGELLKYPDSPCLGNFCWYKLNNENEIYRWDGKEFIYSMSVPGDESTTKSPLPD